MVLDVKRVITHGETVTGSGHKEGSGVLIFLYLGAGVFCEKLSSTFCIYVAL